MRIKRCRRCKAKRSVYVLAWNLDGLCFRCARLLKRFGKEELVQAYDLNRRLMREIYEKD